MPQRNELYDRLIDDKFGMVELAGSTYYTSEILYSWDPVAYSESGSELASDRKDLLDGQP